MFFKRKENNICVNNKNDSFYVDSFPIMVDIALELTKNENIIKKLNELKFSLEYLSVSPKEKIIKIDEDIKNKLEELKKGLLENNHEADILNLIVSIRVLIKEREMFYNG